MRFIRFDNQLQKRFWEHELPVRWLFKEEKFFFRKSSCFFFFISSGFPDNLKKTICLTIADKYMNV